MPRQGLDCRGRAWIAEAGLGLPRQGLECRGRAWAWIAGASLFGPRLRESFHIPSIEKAMVFKNWTLAALSVRGRRSGSSKRRAARAQGSAWIAEAGLGLPRQGLDCRGRARIAGAGLGVPWHPSSDLDCGSAAVLSSPLLRHLVGGAVAARRGVVRSSIKHAHFRLWLTP